MYWAFLFFGLVWASSELVSGFGAIKCIPSTSWFLSAQTANYYCKNTFCCILFLHFSSPTFSTYYNGIIEANAQLNPITYTLGSLACMFKNLVTGILVVWKIRHTKYSWMGGSKSILVLLFSYLV